MKILLVSALPPPEGGIAEWTTRYLRYCEEHQIDIGLVNIALSGARGAKFNDHTRVFDEISRTKRVLHDMHQQLNISKPSVVHMNTSCGPFGIFRDFLCVRIAYKRHTPVVLHFHCNIESWVHGKARIWALKKMTGMASKVLVLNSASKSFVEPYAKKPPVIVPNFISGDYCEKEHIIREIIREIVFVGHVQLTKGIREIYEAAVKLPDIHFTLVGPVADEIAILPCPKNISLVGSKNSSEVKQYLLMADLYLLPSYTEGFSLSLTEAMATGLPAIASDVGANRDMLEDKGGTIIPAKSFEAILQAINHLSAKETRQEMSKWNIQKVRDKYLTETVISKIIDIYKELEAD